MTDTQTDEVDLLTGEPRINKPEREHDIFVGLITNIFPDLTPLDNEEAKRIQAHEDMTNARRALEKAKGCISRLPIHTGPSAYMTARVATEKAKSLDAAIDSVFMFLKLTQEECARALGIPIGDITAKIGESLPDMPLAPPGIRQRVIDVEFEIVNTLTSLQDVLTRKTKLDSIPTSDIPVVDTFLVLNRTASILRRRL